MQCLDWNETYRSVIFAFLAIFIRFQAKKKGSKRTPFCYDRKRLTVVYVHSHFKTET